MLTSMRTKVFVLSGLVLGATTLCAGLYSASPALTDPVDGEGRTGFVALDASRARESVVDLRTPNSGVVDLSEVVRASTSPPANSSVSLEGEIQDPKGRPFVEPWILALTNTRGPESLVSFEGGSDRFVIDLPPGRWRLRPEAPGLAGKTVQIDVAAAPASTQRLQFRLLATGRLTGTVVTCGLEPLEGFPVLLESLDDERLTRMETAPDGSFTFYAVIEGGYRIHYGSREHPAITPQVCRFLGPRHRVPTVTAPPFVEIRIRVVAAEGEVVPDARVEGVGQRGGSLSGTTDLEGIYRAKFLPAGTYRILASHLTLGRSEARIPVSADSPAQIELQLHD